MASSGPRGARPGREVLIGLGYVLVDDHTDRLGRVRVKGEDDRGERVVIRIDPRTDTLTRLTVDVGYFGHQATARLIAERVLQGLRDELDLQDAGVLE